MQPQDAARRGEAGVVPRRSAPARRGPEARVQVPVPGVRDLQLRDRRHPRRAHRRRLRLVLPRHVLHRRPTRHAAEQHARGVLQQDGDVPGEPKSGGVRRMVPVQSELREPTGGTRGNVGGGGGALAAGGRR